ncbi:GGDEF domain-containing protein [Lactiplantibacillus daowaiensis]|uniref:GGDEF domain-containing protein n=1 Tax=Lactiplantibacillus daowaiensis TaxID=2559918 RepID=A0ABW1RZR2_9LACO|nr:GGDEF domain-containing protein [Lactiplantibacillus daowaiensis]
MTWSHWQIAPFFTSVFFVLGVLALYWLSFNGLSFWVKSRHLHISEDTLNAWYGVIYMLVFVFAIQSLVVGGNYSWQFMNFQLIAIIFCAYFLHIQIPYYFFFPIVLIYMAFDRSLGYWQSWGHALTLALFFWLLNVVRVKYHNQRKAPFMYLLVALPFGGLLWFWMKLKFNFDWQTFAQEWAYLTIFEALLYAYVTMLSQDSEAKLQLAKFASHDALTQTENFAAYTGAVKELFMTSSKKQQPLSMMMFDIDHFKQFNDTYGHLAGDRVLQQVAMVVQTVLNANDPKVTLYRTGGEEFNILFPGYTVADTQTIVTQIFSAINHYGIQFGEHRLAISVSVGVSAMTRNDTSPADFYNRVDQNLYTSKRNGRMRITID